MKGSKSHWVYARAVRNTLLLPLIILCLLGLANCSSSTGSTGERGPEGPTGPIGEQGAAGPAGPTGEQGSVGEQGTQGPIGEQGPAGEQGPIGEQGPAGEQGPIGEQGPAGEQGPIGEQGPAGGAEGPQGDTGPQGEAGPQGPIGATGPQGIQGQAGADGATGPQGPAGTGVLTSIASINDPKTEPQTYVNWHDTGTYNIEVACRANANTGAYFRITVDSESVVAFFAPGSTSFFNWYTVSAGGVQVLGSMSFDGPFTISMFSTDGSSSAILNGIVDRDISGCTFWGAISTT